MSTEDLSSVSTAIYQVIWPAYINAVLKKCQGRRLNKAECVHQPKATEILEACKHLKYNCTLEKDKRYPRDPYDTLSGGRVRVLFKNDHVPINPEITTKDDLLRTIAQFINSTKRSATAANLPAVQAAKQQPAGKEKGRKKNR